MKYSPHSVTDEPGKVDTDAGVNRAAHVALSTPDVQQRLGLSLATKVLDLKGSGSVWREQKGWRGFDKMDAAASVRLADNKDARYKSMSSNRSPG